MKGGWFIGDFEPSAYRTNNCEVCYKKHYKGEKWQTHVHKVATEVNYLVVGHMTIQDKDLKSGDVFVIEPNEIADPEFLEDCELVVVKVPSIIGDKYDV
jgi:quercetin dioxygenase-like cupin family protein